MIDVVSCTVCVVGDQCIGVVGVAVTDAGVCGGCVVYVVGVVYRVVTVDIGDGVCAIGVCCVVICDGITATDISKGVAVVTCVCYGVGVGVGCE